MDVELLSLVFRWLHILAAIVLVGGTIFLRVSVVPVLVQQSDQEQWFQSLRVGWSRLVMMSVLFLLVSGLYNSYNKAVLYDLSGSIYLLLLTIKIVLALVVFFLISVLSGRSQRAIGFRAQGAKWYNIVIVLMILLVCIAGYMKLTPVKLESEEPQQLSLQQPVSVEQSVCDHITLANDERSELAALTRRL